MHSGTVMCMAFPGNSFKVMWGCDNKKSYAGVQIRFAPGSQVRREEEQGSEASILFAYNQIIFTTPSAFHKIMKNFKTCCIVTVVRRVFRIATRKPNFKQPLPAKSAPFDCLNFPPCICILLFYVS